MNNNDILPPSIAIMEDSSHISNRSNDYYKNTDFITVEDGFTYEIMMKAILKQISKMAESVTYNNELSDIKEVLLLNNDKRGILTDIDARLSYGDLYISSRMGEINAEYVKVTDLIFAKDYSWVKIGVYLWGYFTVHMDIKLKEEYTR